MLASSSSKKSDQQTQDQTSENKAAPSQNERVPLSESGAVLSEQKFVKIVKQPTVVQKNAVSDAEELDRARRFQGPVLYQQSVKPSSAQKGSSSASATR